MATILGNGNISFGDSTIQSTASNKVTVVKIQRGYTNFFAQTSNNKIYSWGFGDGSVATGQGISTSQMVTELQFGHAETGTISDWCMQGTSGYCLFSTGNLYVWGYNGYGQLGVGDTTARSAPILSATNVAAIYYPPTALHSENRSVALHMIYKSNTGTFYGCGYNGYGELGLGNTTQQNSWVALSMPVGKTVTNVWIASHPQNKTFIKTSDNLIYGTGENTTGALGVGTNTNVTTFTQITYFNTITDVIDIQCGGYQDDGTNLGNYNSTTVLTTSGNIHTAGYNGSGQLGTGGTTSRNTFAQVTLTKPVRKLIKGGLSLYVIFTDNTYAKWGYNGGGMIANGTTTDALTPVYSSTTCVDIFIATPSIYNHQYPACWILKSTGLYFCGQNWNQAGIPTLAGGVITAETLVTTLPNVANIADIIQTNGGSPQSVLVRYANSNKLYGCGTNQYYQLNYIGNQGTHLAFRNVFDAEWYAL